MEVRPSVSADTSLADTLIVWTEPEQDGGIDMALSFQEAEGCGQIWWVATLLLLPSRDGMRLR